MANATQYFGRFRQIYNCYAIVELDRPASETVFTISDNKNLIVGTPLIVMGHPMGLPTKISDNAKLRSFGTKSFEANLDTYGGNRDPQ